MANLSVDTVNRLMISLTSQQAGQEVVNAMNNAASAGWYLPTLIIATSTSTTTDFADLVVGDIVGILPASAGNSHFVEVATAATLPEAAVIGSLYVVFRAVPAATTQTL